MRKEYLKYLAILFLIVTAISCKKRPFDYRNKYLGSWQFEFTQRVEYLGPPSYTVNTGSYKGEINYRTRWAKSQEIIITFKEGGPSLYVDVDKNGKLIDPQCIGSFSGENKVSLTYAADTAGYHPGFFALPLYSYTITGTR